MTLNIREAVQEQVENKIAAGEALDAAIADAERARIAHEEADATVVRVRREALSAGWSEAELKKLGLLPTTRASRSRTKRAPAPAPSSNTSSEADNAQ